MCSISANLFLVCIRRSCGVSFVVSLFGSFLAVTDGRHGRSSVTAVTTKDAGQPNTRLATVK